MGVVGFRTRIIGGLTIGIGILLMFGLTGCSRRQPTPPQVTPGPTAVQTLPDSTVGVDKGELEAVVVDYLNALYSQKYEVAYQLLSKKSKELHTEESFAEDAASGQVMYDLKSAAWKLGDKNKAEVIVRFQQEEEPGNKGFSLIRENGEWKLIYIKGTPFFPYQE